MAERPQSLFEPESPPPPSTSEELVGLRARLTAKQETRAVPRRPPWPVFVGLGLVLIAAVMGVVNWARTPRTPQPAAPPAATDVVPPQPVPDPAATAAAARAAKTSVPPASRPAGEKSAARQAKTAGEPSPAAPAATVLPPPVAEPPVVKEYVVTTADRRGVDVVVERFRDGVAKLDAEAVRAVWPTANAQDLARELGQLREHQVEVHSCDFDIKETTAAATCTGVAGYAKKVGSANLQFDDRRWVFTLKRAGEGWIIQDVVIR